MKGDYVIVRLLRALPVIVNAVRRNPSRHCARSKAIAYTTDRFGASATASYLAVTVAVLRKGIKPNTTKYIGSHLIILNS
jgi:hypothetical protein